MRSSQSMCSPYSHSSRRRKGSAEKAQGQPGSVYSVMRTSAMREIFAAGGEKRPLGAFTGHGSTAGRTLR